jgi:hypothetical protein
MQKYLIELRNNQQFTIPGLAMFRNLRLVRSNDCSAVISGDRKLRVNDKEIWTQIPSGYTVSAFTVVDI